MKKRLGLKVSNLIIGILALIVGIFLIAADASILATWTFRLVGVIMIITNIGPFIYAVKIRNYFDLILRIILLVFGVMTLFYFNTTFSIIIGLIFIIVPLIVVLISDDKKAELIEKLPTIIIGIVILMISPGKLVKWFYIILGILLALYGAILILTSVYVEKEIDNEKKNYY